MAGGEISAGGFYVVGLETEAPFLDDTVPHQIRDGARSLSLFSGRDGNEVIDVAFWPPYLTAGSFARKVDGSGVWVSCDLASPGQPNSFPGSPEDQVRLLAASELGWIPIRDRGVVLTRGSLIHAAKNEFPSALPGAMRELAQACQDPNPAVRREAVAALGEWADGTVVSDLSRLLEKSDEQPVSI